MKILDGRKIAGEIEEKLTSRIKRLKKQGKSLVLAAILVGNDESSRIYIRVKEKACQKMDLGFSKFELGEETEESEIIELIKKLNKDPQITGILLQLPLPKGFSREGLIKAISENKDIDGFRFIEEGKGKFFPPTPLGIITLL